MLKIPKSNRWEENAFKFVHNKTEITAILRSKEDHHEIAMRVNYPPAQAKPDDIRYIASRFLERHDLFFLSSKRELMPGARRLIYYPGLVAN